MLKFMFAAAAMAAGLGAGAASAAAAVEEVTIQDTGVFPESITSTKGGDLIIGSAAKGAVYRAKAGEDKASLWLDPAETGIKGVLGVFADNRANTLYVCSISPQGQPRQPEYSVLRTFDLKTGKAKAAYPMPDPGKATCNDIDVGPNGDAYVTDTGNGRILRLKKGAKALELWAADTRLAGTDGLALGKGVLYVNTVTTSRLFAIPILKDGQAGAMSELTPSQKIQSPDGMRALGGNRFLMAENSPVSGQLDEVTVTGGQASIKVLKAQPGVTAMTRIGDRVWINNAKFGYRGNGPMKGQSPEPFTEFAIPYP